MQLIYILRQGKRTGPFSLDEINRRLAAGTLHPMELGWSEESPGWKPLLSFTGVLMPGAASSISTPIGIATPWHGPPREYAGFWIRLAAAMIDTVLLALVATLIILLFPSSDATLSMLRNLIAALICFLYMPLLWASGSEATLGQRLFRLRVMRLDGAPLSFARALVRAFVALISLAVSGLGFIAIAFSNRKLAWHDRVADTCVQRWTR